MKTIQIECTVMRSSTAGTVEIEAKDDQGLLIKLSHSDLANDMALALQDAPGVDDPWDGDLVVSFAIPDRVAGTFARSKKREQVFARLRCLTDDQVEKIGAAIEALDPRRAEKRTGL